MKKNGVKNFKLLLIVLFVASILLLMLHPYSYDLNYCENVFMFSAIISLLFIYVTSKQEGVFNFHTIFIFSFFCINYLHAVFIYPDDSLFPSLYNFYYSSSIIPYSLGVAQVGLISYMLGVAAVFKDNNECKFPQVKVSFKKKVIDTLAIYIAGGLSIYILFIRSNADIHLYPRLMVLFASALFTCLFIKCSNSTNITLPLLIRNNKKCFLAIVLYILSQLYIGSRAEVLFLSFAVLGLINRYYYKLSVKILVIAGGLGILLFAIITFTRISSINFTTSSIIDVIEYGWDILVSSENFIILSLTDFIVNVRNLYDGIVYAQENGLLYGQSYVPYLFSFIPFGGSVLTPLIIGKIPSEVNTATILTNNIDANYGIGTNIIADVYMNFSLCGVIVFMFLFGMLVQKSKQSSSVSGHFLYFSLLANAMYLGRASIVAWVDMFVFNLIIYYAIIGYSRIKSKV